MARYLDPKADVTFKKVFGEHKNLVMSLLNAMLPLDEGKQIEKIEYLPAEITPRTPLSKDTIVDVRCEETGGRQFIVEMQMNWRADFYDRVLFNASKAYVQQLDKGEQYHLLQPVYSLSFINDTFEPDMEEYYHYYHLVHYLHSDKVLDGLHLVFVELPKFKAKSFTEKKMQALWLRFLTEIDEHTKKADKSLMDDPHVNEALEIVEESALNAKERAEYDGFWDQVRRNTALMDDVKEAHAIRAKFDAAVAELDAAVARADAAVARADAAVARADAAVAQADVEKARADAAVEKLRQDKLQIARKMKAKGFSSADISEFTGLGTAEIERI